MENRIKEQQLGLFADRSSCHEFAANQFRVLLSAAAYVLMEFIRREGLGGTELAKAQVSTIRLGVRGWFAPRCTRCGGGVFAPLHRAIRPWR
jgi:hypothetical protein